MLYVPFGGRMGKNSIFDQNPHVQIESIKELFIIAKISS